MTAAAADLAGAAGDALTTIKAAKEMVSNNELFIAIVEVRMGAGLNLTCNLLLPLQPFNSWGAMINGLQIATTALVK